MQRTAPLPTQNGVGPSCVVLPPGSWATIFDFLRERFRAIPAATWQARVQRGDVVDEHGVAVTPERPYVAGLRLYYYRSIDNEPRLPFDETVLFQDDLLVVADKPHFLPVTPGGRHLQETLLVRLKRRLGIDTLAPLHRLDRETAGVVVFAVRPDTRGAYQALFAQRRVTKHYEAIAPWRPELPFPLTHRSRLMQDDHFLRMREVPGEPNAETLVELLGVLGDLARYRLTPLTGRTHQLRVHCAALGMPIAGDRMYPALLPADTDVHARPLQLLARSIAFIDPISGASRQFDSALRLSLAPPA
ncbi:MAG: pseudouridine synthase [Burkholderiales bacterium PBB1]|nr:MAG: pseudouridine synthase [Burkholderiales bacterium PBB1]